MQKWSEIVSAFRLYWDLQWRQHTLWEKYFLICNKFSVAKATGFTFSRRKNTSFIKWIKKAPAFDFDVFLASSVNLSQKSLHVQFTHKRREISITEHYSISLSYQYNVFLFQWVFFSIVCPACFLPAFLFVIMYISSRVRMWRAASAKLWEKSV